MSDVVIRAEGLGKKYVIGHQGEIERYTSLRDVVARGARGIARSARDLVGGKLPARGDDTAEDFWALKDVNFEIKRGEVVGIIGRNGAGKSTLLKILSRITEPTEGRVEIKGRVASLLEVGTGFHPELTGRENIYLNGAILGMSRAEIRRKFDEIVAFADVEKFLDTPVKRYSSGMYVRLAFAVAAHLEPEILVVDEVLAVGDAEFQKKCLGKMGEVAGQGRTVLFVSHNMGAVRGLCHRGFILKAGSLCFDGNVESAINLSANTSIFEQSDNSSNSTLMKIKNINQDISTGEISVGISFLSQEKVDLEIRCLISDAIKTPIGIASKGGFNGAPLSFDPGSFIICINLNFNQMADGFYNLTFQILSRNTGCIIGSSEINNLEWSPPPLPGEGVYLSADWRLGHRRFPMQIEVTA